MTSLPEHADSLWWLTVSPTLWAFHFLASYGTAAVWCAKVAGRDGSLGAARVAIAAYTAVALAGVLATGFRAWRHARWGDASTRHLDSSEDRRRFLGLSTLLLSGLSAVAIAYAALAVVYVGDCR
jgi:hypothetical protein